MKCPGREQARIEKNTKFIKYICFTTIDVHHSLAIIGSGCFLLSQRELSLLSLTVLGHCLPSCLEQLLEPS